MGTRQLSQKSSPSTSSWGRQRGRRPSSPRAPASPATAPNERLGRSEPGATVARHWGQAAGRGGTPSTSAMQGPQKLWPHSVMTGSEKSSRQTGQVASA